MGVPATFRGVAGQGVAGHCATRSVNAVMTATYFLVGRAVVEFEQKGAERAAYGAQLLERLGADLSARFGRGFSPVNLGAMRLFYLTYVDEISQALSKKSELETLRGDFPCLGPSTPCSYAAHARPRPAPSTRPRLCAAAGRCGSSSARWTHNSTSERPSPGTRPPCSRRAAYVFSDSRSGDTAKNVLGGTTGWLTIDGYTGYNIVTDVDGRDRTGCWSHSRRYLFDALATAPEAREGLDIILDLFMVERAAQQEGIAGTKVRLVMRQERSAPVLERLRQWRDRMLPLFEPKSPMVAALKYMSNQWERLCAYPFTRSLADRGIALCGSILRVMTRIRCPLA